MNPGQIIGLLGWIGWIVGIASGLLQFMAFRRERRIGPAKEQLFEEALRDRRGMYSEAQIVELKELVGNLERSVRDEIPRRARRVYIENQLETIGESILNGVRQHDRLSKQLGELAGESKAIPPEIVAAVESSIAAPAVERHRQQRRLYLLLVVLVALATFPAPLEYVRGSLEEVLGDQPWPYGPDNAFDYLTGCVVATFAAFMLPVARVRRSIRLRPGRWFAAAAALLTLALISVIGIGVALALSIYVEFTVAAGIFSSIFAAAGVRLTYLVIRRG